MNDSQLTFSDVDSVIRYDADTGKLFWKHRDANLFPDEKSYKKWNGRFGGKEAFTAYKDGYKHGSIFYKYLKAHRVIWLLVYGEWPNGEIDHIDGNRENNRIHNLRVVTSSENARNRKVQSNNKSGVPGVGWRNDTNKWYARIKILGEYTYLGNFENFEDAVSAKKSAEIEHGFHENNGRL